jgi:hypothetical protein
MNPHDIEDLLSQQADQLLAGEGALLGPATAGAMAGLAPAEQGRLTGLLQLAARMRKQFVAVEPRPAFIAEVKQRLLAAERIAAASTAQLRSQQQRLMWMAGLGGAAYLASLGVVSYMAARAGKGLMRSAAAARAAHTDGGKAQPAP